MAAVSHLFNELMSRAVVTLQVTMVMTVLVERASYQVFQLGEETQWACLLLIIGRLIRKQAVFRANQHVLGVPVSD